MYNGNAGIRSVSCSSSSPAYELAMVISASLPVLLCSVGRSCSSVEVIAVFGKKACGSVSSSSLMSISTSLSSISSSTLIVEWAEELGTLSTCSSSEEEDWSWPKVFLRAGAIVR